MVVENNAQQVVMSCVKALNAEDFETARRYVSDDISFLVFWARATAPMRTSMTWNGCDSNMTLRKYSRYGNDVCLFYDLAISGVTIFGCAWYQVANEKLRCLRVVFDPRPVLESRTKLGRSA
jgi:hypothetical protein